MPQTKKLLFSDQKAKKKKKKQGNIQNSNCRKKDIPMTIKYIKRIPMTIKYIKRWSITSHQGNAT